MAVEISQSLGHQSLHQEIYLKRVPSSFCVLIVLVSSLCNPTQWCFQSGNSCDILCLDLQELLAQLQDFTHTLFNKISLSITINQHCHFPKRFYGLMLHSVTKIRLVSYTTACLNLEIPSSPKLLSWDILSRLYKTIYKDILRKPITEKKYIIGDLLVKNPQWYLQHFFSLNIMSIVCTYPGSILVCISR